jgi:formylglycine-generating enzyme required for sulfatase activity
MNCIDRQTAATYCAARGARLPTDRESERAAESVGNGADGASGSVSEWTRDGYRARFADGVSDAKAVAAWRGVTGARSYAIGFRCAAD